MFDFLKGRKPEKREITGEMLLAELNGGYYITAKQAQEIPAVSACLEYVGNKVALLPLRLYERDGEGKIIEIKNDRRTRLFNIQPSEYFDGFLFKKMLAKDYILYGRCYAYIKRRFNEVEELIYLQPGDVTQNTNTDALNRYVKHWVQGKSIDNINIFSCLRSSTNGGEGRGLLDDNAETLRTAYSELLQIRRNKLAALRAEGADPFEQTLYPVDAHAAEIKAEFAGTTPVKLPDYIGAADYMQLLDDILADEGQSPMYTDRIIKTRAGYDPDLYPDVDWIDAVTKDWASNQRVTAEVSGGNNILTYSLVAAVYNEQGILTRDPSRAWDPSIKLQRYNVRTNVDINITKTTKFRINIGGYLQDRNSTTQSIDQIFSDAFKRVPFDYPVRYSTGQIPAGTGGNVWAMATQMGYKTTSASKIETLFSLEQDLKFITPGLRIKGTFSFDRYSSGAVSRSTSPDLYNPTRQRNEDGTLVLNRSSVGSNTLGYNVSGEYGNKSLYVEIAANYDRTFAGKHAVSGLLLANRRNYDKGEKLPYRTQGLAGRVSYTYDNRYVAEFNFGYNGSENFAPGKRYGFFPSAAVGWVISEEPFMAKTKKVISNLKIRASYGQTGNASLSGRRFAYLSTVTDDYDTLDMYKWGIESGYGIAGMAEGDFAVPDLTWEKVNKANIGIEIGLLDGVFDLAVDVFDERRNNIFMERTSIPLTAGFIKTPWQNFGKVKNQGAEVTVNLRKQFGKDFFLSMMGTFTYAHNEIVEMDEPRSIIGTNRARTGHPVNQIFGYIDEGLYTDADFDADGTLRDDLPKCGLSTTVRPGDIKYKDVNNDGKIDVYDQSAIGGTNDPEIVYGFGLNLSWKDIDFGILFQGTGRTWRLMSSNILPGQNSGGSYNVFSNYNDRWTADNPIQDCFYPRLTYGPNTINAQPSTWWLKDMSFLRLKNIEIGYSLPQSIADRSFIAGARIFVRGTNLLTFSKFKLWDPELDSADGAQYPLMKSISAGLEFKF